MAQTQVSPTPIDTNVRKPIALLALLRMSRGWSQHRVGDSVGCTKAAISRIEAGIDKPRPALASRLEVLFSKPIAELLTFAELDDVEIADSP
jgi:transcriptional regulator with XRE-family HTH domain